MKRKQLFYNLICPIIGAVLIACVWAAAAAIYNKPLILPRFSSVAVSFFKLLGPGRFHNDMALTFARSIICFMLAYAFALPLSILAAFNKTFASIFKPFVEVLRSVPMIAVILLALVLFSSSVLPIVVGFLIVFPLAYSALYNALLSDEVTGNLAMCKFYKVRKRDIIRYVYLPALAPVSVVQAETLLPLAVKVVISGEVLAYTRNGLGLAMQSAQINVEIDKLVAYALMTVLLSYVCLGFVKLVKLALKRCGLCR